MPPIFQLRRFDRPRHPLFQLPRRDPFPPLRFRQPGRYRTEGGFLRRFFSAPRGIERPHPFDFRFPGSLFGGSTVPPPAPSFFQRLNLDTISRFLGQTQQVLGTVQQMAPMIQQYGPLIKNLPSLWKLYREMKDIGEDEKSEEGLPGEKEKTPNVPADYDDEPGVSQEKKEAVTTNAESEKVPKPPKKKQKKEIQTKPSVPKLYI